MWNDARAFVRACRLREGKGIRLHETPDGTFISADIGGAPWNHPFRVFLIGNTAANIFPGFVNGSIEPEIDGVPLSGSEKKPPPTLKFQRVKLDAERRGYIALEAEFDPNWTVKKGKVKVVQVAYFDSLDGEDPPANAGGKSGAGGVPILKGRLARWPLAMLRARTGGRLDVFQITHGDLQLRAQPRNSKAETGRAFWW
jgi:hypothetical protein